ncbi:MAG: hypothetical protein AB8U25_05560 [Rickettsiales endosymbiont of Dermacentor nuttalli]
MNDKKNLNADPDLSLLELKDLLVIIEHPDIFYQKKSKEIKQYFENDSRKYNIYCYIQPIMMNKEAYSNLKRLFYDKIESLDYVKKISNVFTKEELQPKMKIGDMCTEINNAYMQSNA